MVTLKSNYLKRTFAMLMAIVLVLGMLPIPGVTAATSEHPNTVTITVKDSEGAAISGASVHYVISGESVDTIDNTKVTDEHGTIEVLPEESFVEGAYKISATASCDEYVTATLNEQSITSATQDFIITMEKDETEPEPQPVPGITVTPTIENYTGEAFPAVTITGTQNGDTVTVTVDGTPTVLNANGRNMPKIKDVGSYEVKVDVSREGYVDFTETVTSVISKNTLVIQYEGINEAYTGEEFDAIKLASGATLPAVDSITYKLNDGEPSNSIPKISDVGTYTIHVHAEKAGYEDFDQDYTSVISKNTLVIQYEGINEAYTGEAFDAIILASGATLPAVDSITYTLNDGEPSNSIPKISAVGTYTIHVHAEKTGYEDFDQDYTSEITLGVIDDSRVSITGQNNIYNGNPQQLVKISGPDKNLFTYSFKITGEDEVYTNEADVVKTDVGTYEITVTLSRENYADKNVVVTARITKGTQEIAFTNTDYEDGGNATINYSENLGDTPLDFSITIVTGGDPAITYSLQFADTDDETENDFASIDENGQLTISGVGTVTIIATQAGDSNYESAEISFTLTVIPPSNGKYIKFNEATINYFLGTEDGVVATQVAERIPVSNYGIQDRGTITYHFADSAKAEEYGLNLNTTNHQAKVMVTDYAALSHAIEEHDGSISVIIVAEKAKWRMFPADSASYEIIIKFADLTLTYPYSFKENLEGETPMEGPNGENGWCKTAVYVIPGTIPAESEDGTPTTFSICREINKDANGFAEYVYVDEQGTAEKYVYLRNNETGGISAKVKLEWPDHANLNIDSVQPADCAVSYEEPSALATVGEVLSLGFYQASVEVTFTANDVTSGVDHFEWWYVREDGVSDQNAGDTEHAVVKAVPVTEDVKDEETGEITTVIKGYTATITLSTSEYNQMRGKIFAIAVDAAGHSSEESADENGFVLDTIGPNGSVSYTAPDRKYNGKEYFNNAIEFTLTITENNFFAEDVKVTIGNKDANVSWTDTSPEIHVGKFTVPATDGDYIVKVSYTDKSGNEPYEYSTGTLVVDTTKPTIDTKYENPNSDTQQLVLTITEHNFNAADIDVTFAAKDIAGKDVTTNQTDILAFIRNANNWTNDGDKHTITIKQFADANYNLKFNYADLATNPADSKDEQFTIDHTAPDYARMTVTYSDSLQDTVVSALTLGFYQPQVTVTFTAYDVTSGVKQFEWGYNRQNAASTVNLEADSGTLTAVQDSKDKTKFTASIALPRDVANQLRGNIYFTATDKKDNKSQTVTDNGTVLVVDSIAPRITNIAYSTPSATVGSDKYYNNPATLTLTINEANFFQEDVQIVIEREGGGTAQANVTWVNNSVDEHVATIAFAAPAGGGADGHYKVTVNYTDRSRNKMQTFTSDRITIDTTAPTISVSYDNNDLTSENYFNKTVGNEKYFKAGRVATITIVEHNFNSDKVTVSANAAGRGAETPVVSAWTSNGDTHTATVTFTADGDYTFDVSAIDVSENKSGDVDYKNSAAPKEFTIDTVPEMITIEPNSIVEGKAYTYDDTVIPEITVSDDNLEGYEITLKGYQRGAEVDLTSKVLDLVEVDGNTVTVKADVFAKSADLDGIYTLTVRSTDLSDNHDEKSVRFTVNRFGSVYEYSENLQELIENGGTYNQSIDEDLTFTIYNASPIDPDNVSVVITRDGRPVDAVFTVTETTPDANGWYSYLVTIEKSNFEEDGVYTISVSAKDASDLTRSIENTGENSDGDIQFFVDSTAPQLTSVNGLEESIVNATELEVSYTVYDTIGLASVQVKVDGEIVDSATDFDDASNYSGKFTIYEKSSAQHVSFILTDKAGNVTESDAEGFSVPYTLEKDVTVSTNLFVRWFANKPLFFGGIGGGLAVLGGLGALLGLKKKKKEKVG